MFYTNNWVKNIMEFHVADYIYGKSPGSPAHPNITGSIRAGIGGRMGTGKGKTGCPFCSNRKVHEKNSLFNCFPKIAKELHPTRNGSITSKQIVYGSNRNVWCF